MSLDVCGSLEAIQGPARSVPLVDEHRSAGGTGGPFVCLDDSRAFRYGHSRNTPEGGFPFSQRGAWAEVGRTDRREERGVGLTGGHDQGFRVWHLDVGDLLPTEDVEDPEIRLL